RPDFVHSSSGRNLVLIVERADSTKWHIFHMRTLSFLTTFETAQLGRSFDFSLSEMLSDNHLLFWKRGEGRIAIVHTPRRYFAESAVTIYEIDLAIYWVAYCKDFVYFGGHEVKQFRPKDSHYSTRDIVRIWISRESEPLQLSARSFAAVSPAIKKDAQLNGSQWGLRIS
ncbi:hypothetical protein PMAYCL1PPCAC_22031, partial [Pristionchus mayeri]